MNGKARITAAIANKPVDSLPLIPISMQIAADAIGIKYRTYATDWREQVRGQLAFAELYDIDHVSVISDPATESADCGASIIYHDDSPPAIDEENALLKDKTALATISIPDPRGGRRMTNRLRAVEELKSQVRDEKIVEGWVEGPVAESCDLRGISRLMMDFFDDPDFVTDLMEFVFEMEMAYAREQIACGADVIGIGDAAASLIGPDLYEEFAFPLHVRYVQEIHKMGALVRLHVCGDSRPLLPFLPKIKADIVDLDHIAPVALAREQAGPTQVLSGNVDPVTILKDGTPETVTREIERCYVDADRSAYMVAAGCEIPRGTPAENLAALSRFARSHSYDGGDR